MSDGLPQNFAERIKPGWSAEQIRRVLTDEPGKGMGAPFSDADAKLFLRACGLLAPPLAPNEANPELLDRMWRWCSSNLR
jgi:hypothetical protein